MALEVDVLIERRRLKRRLGLWRLGAVLGALALIVVWLSRDGGPLLHLGLGDHVARVWITGLIKEDWDRQKLFEELANSPRVKAVVVHIDSPGGTASGGEAIYESLRQIASKKPVTAVFGGVAASAAYLSGVACDHIVARGNSLTGSVGVFFQWPDVSGLLNAVGVKVETIKSGPLKANPSPFEPLDEAGRKLVEKMVSDSQKWFVGLVTGRRRITGQSLEELKTGRVYSGREALAVGLIDEIGDEKTALAWLEKERGLSKSLSVIDWKPEHSDGFGAFRSAAQAILGIFGFEKSSIFTFLADAGGLSAQRLDGLVAVWRPEHQQ
jgi:protease-4